METTVGIIVTMSIDIDPKVYPLAVDGWMGDVEEHIVDSLHDIGGVRVVASSVEKE